jgi:hypothetical protein
MHPQDVPRPLHLLRSSQLMLLNEAPLAVQVWAFEALGQLDQDEPASG